MSKNLFVGSIISFLLFIPVISLAQLPSAQGPSRLPPSQGPGGDKVELTNPLGVDTFEELVSSILDAAFIIGLPIAVLFIVIAGFRFVAARGNPEKLKTARTNLLYTIIGIAVFFGAWTLAKIIEATIKGLGVGS